MKKLLLLALVVAGWFGTASAWNTMYLNCEDNNWGSNGSLEFKWVDTNSYYYILSPDHITKGDFYFRFYASWDNNNGGEDVAPKSDGLAITSVAISDVERNSKEGAFKIAKNEDAKFVAIYIYWANETWNLYSQVLTETTDVAFVNSQNWDNVYIYSWDNKVEMTGEWPGTKIGASTDGSFLKNLAFSANSMLIFNDGKDENSISKTSDLTLVENGVYNASGRVENVSANIGSLGYATFSSAYPVDFTEATDVTAYRAEQTASNEVLLKKVTGKVPAATGLVLKGSGEVTIPTTATGESVGTNNLIASVNATTITPESGTSDYYYFLSGTNASDVGFYLLANSMTYTSDAGKAYYHASTPLKTTGATRATWIFEDETQGINSVENAQNADVVYDLQGRAAKTAKAGLYIKDGKKYFVK